jgi:hypothetical protein
MSKGWSVRKMLGFESEEQYDRYKLAAQARGLTVAQFFSWLADSMLQSGERSTNHEVLDSLESEEDVARIHIFCSREAKDRVKILARNSGMSMSKFLLFLVEITESKMRKITVLKDISMELSALTLIEHCIDNEDLDGARSQLTVLRKLMIDSIRDNVNGSN